LGFKVAAAPFQVWTPDVYEAHHPGDSALRAGPKAATFALLLRIFTTIHAATDFWFWAFWILAVVTMFRRQPGALVQTNVKRLLAYSSIAHAGYTLVAFAAVTAMKLTGNRCRAGVCSRVVFTFGYSLVKVGVHDVSRLAPG